MRRGVDTNVLVYAHVPAFREHGAVRSFLLQQLTEPDLTLVLTAGVLHEFVHVVTDARRFDPPVAIAEAIGVARIYLGRTNVECAAIDGLDVVAAFDLMERYNIGRNRIADTLFAAALLRRGVHELITCNPGDFQVFESFTLIDPRTHRP